MDGTPHFVVATGPMADGAVVVSAEGELHMSTAPVLGARVREALRGGASRLVVDLTAVQFIDSTGLGVLLNALRETERTGGGMAVVCSNPTVLRLFTITGTDETLGVRPTREAALGALRTG